MTTENNVLYLLPAPEQGDFESLLLRGARKRGVMKTATFPGCGRQLAEQ